jgi:hypothetical protein
MKRFELVKRDDHYGLYNEDGHKIAATIDGCNSKLSKENCDEIFGVFDVEKLFLETPHTIEDEKDYWKIRAGYIEGFNKAMELNDKLFTVEDMKKLMYATIELLEQDEGEPIKFLKEFIQSLQQPKEIDVEIVMGTLCRQIDCVDDARLVESKIVWGKEDPMLDENGCLILKKL